MKKHLVNLGKILSDWIVIYEIIEEKFVLILLRTGTHQDTFSKTTNHLSPQKTVEANSFAVRVKNPRPHHTARSGDFSLRS